jgi:histidinol-phosphate/aromatic aminotransferase/cobyric acid decarboxylase-like protein
MSLVKTASVSEVNDITTLVARKDSVTRAMILPFADFTPLLADLLRMHHKPGSRLLSAGHVLPEVELAADRSGVAIEEARGESPFVGDVQPVLDAIESDKELIYIANPNRVTGADFSLDDLKKLAQAVPNGAVIVDEYYHDFYGITAAPLLEMFPNVIILRSFTAAFGIQSAEAGYVLSNPWVISRMEQEMQGRPISKTVRRTIMQTIVNQELVNRRLHEVHEESLRLATGLSGLGVQSKITATDFLLMRVNDPKELGNALAAEKVYISNLDGYPELDHYVRYRIQSPLSNDKFMDTMKKMPSRNYKMASIDRRMVRSRRAAEQARPPERTSVLGEAGTAKRPSRFRTEKPDLIKTS